MSAGSSTMALDARDLTMDDIVARLAALEPTLRERSREIQAARRLPADVVQALRDAGVFRAAMPRELGGSDLTPMEQVALIEEAARIETSVGWCVMIGMDSGIYARYLEPDVARAMFPTPDMIVAGWVPPAGRAHEVPGGYRVDGHWRFGSGCTHADWIAGGCTVYRDGAPVLDGRGKPLWRMVLMAPADVTIIDTWHTTGLAGTGSCDYTAESVSVPVERSFSFSEPRHDGPLTRRGDAIVRKMPGVALGAGRAALDFVLDLARHRTDQPGDVPWADSARVQRVVGECETLLGAARSFVYTSLEEQWTHLVAGRDLDARARSAAALSRRNAFRAARDITQRLYDLVGGESVYATAGPLDTLLRDMTTACQHVVAQDRVLEWAGDLLMGGQPETPFL